MFALILLPPPLLALVRSLIYASRRAVVVGERGEEVVVGGVLDHHQQPARVRRAAQASPARVTSGAMGLHLRHSHEFRRTGKRIACTRKFVARILGHGLS